jgi:hypothetical protein
MGSGLVTRPLADEIESRGISLRCRLISVDEKHHTHPVVIFRYTIVQTTHEHHTFFWVPISFDSFRIRLTFIHHASIIACLYPLYLAFFHYLCCTLDACRALSPYSYMTSTTNIWTFSLSCHNPSSDTYVTGHSTNMWPPARDPPGLEALGPHTWIRTDS